MHVSLTSVPSHRDRGWQPQDDSGYDLDHYPAFCHPGHQCGGDDCQGGSAALVPAQDSALQECQCPELPHLLQGHYHPPCLSVPVLTPLLNFPWAEKVNISALYY